MQFTKFIFIFYLKCNVGKPYAMKTARTVWVGGKRKLPIDIKQ